MSSPENTEETSALMKRRTVAIVGASSTENVSSPDEDTCEKRSFAYPSECSPKEEEEKIIKKEDNEIESLDFDENQENMTGIMRPDPPATSDSCVGDAQLEAAAPLPLQRGSYFREDVQPGAYAQTFGDRTGGTRLEIIPASALTARNAGRSQHANASTRNAEAEVPQDAEGSRGGGGEGEGDESIFLFRIPTEAEVVDESVAIDASPLNNKLQSVRNRRIVAFSVLIALGVIFVALVVDFATQKNSSAEPSIELNDTTPTTNLASPSVPINPSLDPSSSPSFRPSFSSSTVASLFERVWSIRGQVLEGSQIEETFGLSVAISYNGSAVASGAPLNDGNGIDSGVVRVYQFNDSTTKWEVLGNEIYGQNEADLFGISVALSSDGHTVAAGAPLPLNGDGYIRVFRYIDGIWERLGDDIYGAIGAGFCDFCISALGLSADGNVVAGGSHWNEDGAGDGKVRVLRYNEMEDRWEQLGRILYGQEESEFGLYIALSFDGTILAVGAHFGNVTLPESADVLYRAGYVQVFKYEGSDWSQLGDDLTGENEQDDFGCSVALSNDGLTIAVGVCLNSLFSYSGQVHVYRYEDTWEQIGSTIYGDDNFDRSGFSVALSGDGLTLLIGTPYHLKNGANSGQIRAYRFFEGDWRKLGQSLYGRSEGDRHGWLFGIAGDGLSIVGGSLGSDKSFRNAGEVVVYSLIDPQPSSVPISSNPSQSPTEVPTYEPSESPMPSMTTYPSALPIWLPLGQPLVNNNDLDSLFGFSLAASNDGSIVAVGAPGNGQQPGFVEVYKFDERNKDWRLVGDTISGTQTNDFYGNTVALSSDGLTLAAVDPQRQFSHGVAHVFKFKDGTWTKMGDTIFEVAHSLSCEYCRVGLALSASGEVVAIGGARDDHVDSKAGNVKVFEYRDDRWYQRGITIYGEVSEEQIGLAVDISSDGLTIAVGAPGGDANQGQPGLLTLRTGLVRVFRYNGENWERLGEDIYGDAVFEEFGCAVSLSGDADVLAIGSCGSGMAGIKIYSLHGCAWTLFGTALSGISDDSYDSGLLHLQLSNDGKTFIVGMPINPGSHSGSIQAYRYVFDEWIKLGESISNANSLFGFPVAISGDGNIIMAGSPTFDAEGGEVKVFRNYLN